MPLFKEPLTIEDLFDPSNMKICLEKYNADDDYVFNDKLDNTDPNVYWYKLLYNILDVIHQRQNNHEIDKNDYSKVLKLFKIDTLAYIYINYPGYLYRDVSHRLECLDGRFSMLDPLIDMAWQWYVEDCDSNMIFQLWLTFKNMHEMSIFDDDRFSIHPVFTRAYRKGMDRSPWLKKLDGGWLTVYEESTGEKKMQKYINGAYNTNYLDGKIGFVIYFKSMPSMVVSFNCDKNWNLFIHQIQCKPKDRGHYKLSNWQDSCLNLIRDIFPEFKVHLITGESLIKFSPDAYVSAPEVMKPSQQTLKRICETYNKMFSNLGNIIKKNGTYYHELT